MLAFARYRQNSLLMTWIVESLRSKWFSDHCSYRLCEYFAYRRNLESPSHCCWLQSQTNLPGRHWLYAFQLAINCVFYRQCKVYAWCIATALRITTILRDITDTVGLVRAGTVPGMLTVYWETARVVSSKMNKRLCILRLNIHNNIMPWLLS